MQTPLSRSPEYLSTRARKIRQAISNLGYRTVKFHRRPMWVIHKDQKVVNALTYTPDEGWKLSVPCEELENAIENTRLL